MNMIVRHEVARPQPKQHGEAGTTLVESLIATVILGIGVAAILTGLLAFIRTSNRNDAAARANAVLMSAAEALRDSARTPYVATCAAVPYTPSNAVNGVTLPPGWSSATVAIESVRYWNGAAFGTNCYDTASPTLRLQEITVRITSPDGLGSLSLGVVKRGS